MQNSKSNHWAISDEMLTELPKMLVEIMKKGDTRSKVAAARALISMMNFNMKLEQTSGPTMSPEEFARRKTEAQKRINVELLRRMEERQIERDALAAQQKQSEMN